MKRTYWLPVICTLLPIGFVTGVTLRHLPASVANAPVAAVQTAPTTTLPVERRENPIPASAGVTQSIGADVIAKQERAAVALLHEHALQPKVLPDGTRQFTLTASAFPWYMWLGEIVQAWGYNGQTAGPLLRFRVGERVAIVVHNQLPESTTVHWQGMAVPNAMDGIPGVTQRPIPPGGSFVYRFTVTPQMVGTHYYESRVDSLVQVDHGLYGPVIVDPAKPTPPADVDALYVIGGWNISGGADNEDGFTMDGKPYPSAPQLNVKLGQTVRIRLINASAISAHSMHLHGNTFRVIAIDGHPVAHPQAQNTITMLPGETADIAFTAKYPGRWMFHCHIADHTMNPGDEIDPMGGLMTFVNVQA